MFPLIVPVPAGYADDRYRCWAEIGMDGTKYSVPCSRQIGHDIGLCEQHYKEIVGVCDDEG